MCALSRALIRALSSRYAMAMITLTARGLLPGLLRHGLQGLGVLTLALACSMAALAQPAPDCPPAAQSPNTEQVQAGMRDARDHGFLWRVSKDGRSSYLYGTLHVAKLAWMYPGPHVVQALAATDTVALELDLLDPDVGRRLASLVSASSSTELAEPARQRIARQTAAACLPPEALAALSPELQVMTLATLVARHDGIDPAYGIDLFLSGWGHASGKKVVSLETPELQARLLQTEDAQERLTAVETGLDELESGSARAQVLRIAQVWADADLATLTRYEDWCDCLKTKSDREAMARMLDERNPGLAEAIATLHSNGRQVFAAVGSLHMIGPMGLPALLAQRGYAVERIRYAP